MTKHKKSKYKCDKMQKGIIQIWQNAKGQNTNMTKYKKTIYKYNKTQMWQYAKRQYSNMTKHEKTKYKCDNWQNDKIQMRQTQKDRIQMWKNWNKTTKYKYDITQIIKIQ